LVSLSTIFVMTIMLFSSDTASPSSVMICHIRVANLTCHCQANREPVMSDLFSEFPVVADVAAWGATRFSHLSAVPVDAGLECLDAVQLRRTVLVA
jgi:hypothetical protein